MWLYEDIMIDTGEEGKRAGDGSERIMFSKCHKKSCCRFVVCSHVCRCFSWNVAVLSKWTTHYTLLVMLGWCSFFSLFTQVILAWQRMFVHLIAMRIVAALWIHTKLHCILCAIIIQCTEGWWFFIVVDGTMLYNMKAMLTDSALGISL